MKSIQKESASASRKEDRRQYPRYNVELRVQLIGSGMLPMHVRTVDISVIGMHFDCDRTTAQHLLPPGETMAPSKLYTARFRIPSAGNGSKPLTVVAQVIDVQERENGYFRVNMCFSRFGGQSRARLESYLEGLAPGSEPVSH
jgi:hypothetical protein